MEEQCSVTILLRWLIIKADVANLSNITAEGCGAELYVNYDQSRESLQNTVFQHLALVQTEDCRFVLIHKKKKNALQGKGVGGELISQLLSPTKLFLFIEITLFFFDLYGISSYSKWYLVISFNKFRAKVYYFDFFFSEIQHLFYNE